MCLKQQPLPCKISSKVSAVCMFLIAGSVAFCGAALPPAVDP